MNSVSSMSRIAGKKYIFSHFFPCFLLFLLQISSLLLNIYCKQDLSVGNSLLTLPQPSSLNYVSFLQTFCNLYFIAVADIKQCYVLKAFLLRMLLLTCWNSDIEEKVSLTLSYFLFLQLKHRKRRKKDAGINEAFLKI